MTINLLAMKDRPGIRKRISTGAENEIKITIRNTSRMAISLSLSDVQAVIDAIQTNHIHKKRIGIYFITKKQ